MRHANQNPHAAGPIFLPLHIIPCHVLLASPTVSDNGQTQQPFEHLEELFTIAGSSPLRLRWCPIRPMAQDYGFEIISCKPADEDLVTAVMSEISDRLSKSKKTSTTLGYETLGWGLKCEELFHFGWDVQKFTNSCEPKGAPAAFILSKNDTQLPRWRAQPGWVMIYRPIKEELNSGVGFLKIIEGSHKMTDEQQIRGSQPREICLQPNHILVLDGDAVIEYPLPGGGLGLLKAFKKK